MDDEKLEAIREQWHAFRRIELYRGDPAGEEASKDALVTHIPALLDEVDRLRTENATTQIIVRRLASYDDDIGVVADMLAGWAVCGLCRVSVRIPEYTGPFPHNEHCPITLARAILDK